VRWPTQQDLVAVVHDAGVKDLRVIEAFEQIPRAEFVPPTMVEQAYVDEPLPIPNAQVTTQPSLVAKMVEALGMQPTDTVLEVGTGYGFQTAILAHLASFVHSIERYPDIASTARRRLEAFGVPNVEVHTGDGSEGLPGHSPFDAILISAAFPEVPEPLVEQLVPGGRLVQPMGKGGSDEVTLL
jgi:protein-L-isoaspartate(D-aspartate) O-methyltransferase